MRSTTAIITGIAAVIAGVVGLSIMYGYVNKRSTLGVNRRGSIPNDPKLGVTRCPMCGGPWQNPMNWDGRIPDKLPRPQNREWENRLKVILTREKLSLAQYSEDEAKFNVRMPYMMIIPQERDHIEWIEALFKAYGVSSDGKVPSVKKSESVRNAYQIGMNLEAELIQRYTWLIKNAEDDTTKKVLDTILFQTRMHYTMFAHVLEMQHMGMPGMGGMR
jgi:rubrerythrin